MYDGSLFFGRFGHYGRRINGITTRFGGWLLIAPGISLMLLGLAILIWPELLAYMVAGFLVVTGVTLATWGWRIAQSQKRVRRGMPNGVFYREDTYYGK